MVHNEKITKDIRELSMAANIADTFHGRDCCGALDRVESYIKSLQEKVIPNGYTLVPLEPSPDMMQAGSQVWKDECQGSWGHAACVYKAMICQCNLT